MIAPEDWPRMMRTRKEADPDEEKVVRKANEASVKDGARWDIGGGRASKG